MFQFHRKVLLYFPSSISSLLWCLCFRANFNWFVEKEISEHRKLLLEITVVDSPGELAVLYWTFNPWALNFFFLLYWSCGFHIMHPIPRMSLSPWIHPLPSQPSPKNKTKFKKKNFFRNLVEAIAWPVRHTVYPLICSSLLFITTSHWSGSRSLASTPPPIMGSCWGLCHGNPALWDL